MQLIGQELRFRLELKRVDKCGMEEFLIPGEFINEGKISLKEIKTIVEE